MRTLPFVLALSSSFVAAGVANAQSWSATGHTMEMRIVMDGMPDAPTGDWQAFNYSPTGGMIGFWVQARVRVETGTNFGIGRFSSYSDPEPAEVVLTDSTAGARLGRGPTEGSSSFGIPTAFRTWPEQGRGQDWYDAANSYFDMMPGGADYPLHYNNEPGQFTPDGRRIFGMDAWVGTFRQGRDLNGDGVFESGPLAEVAPAGEWGQWQNLYRFVTVSQSTADRIVTVSVEAQLNGVQRVQRVSGSDAFAIQMSARASYTASLSFWMGATALAPGQSPIVVPGAAAAAPLAGLLGLAAVRRRRAN